MQIRPGEGLIDWNSIVEGKRRKQRAKEELEQEDKLDIYNLDRNYNCVKHIQDQFIDPDNYGLEDQSPIIFKKAQPCPLRSQIKKAKSQMFSELKTIKFGKETNREQSDKMILSFLNERAIQKIIPERE